MLDRQDFQIDTDKVARYFFWVPVLAGLVTGIVPGLLYALTLGRWLPRRQATALRYWLDGSTLRIDEGVVFLKRKAIPLDRVTDIALVQGPLMRRLGIWLLRIQTAGMSGTQQAQGAEGVLYGVKNPEAVRDALLAAREAAAARDAKPTGS
jgi:putative membrane protein